jgi:hypothetical protein
MNLQDVRELIPEFFCLPEFLKNSNQFDFGATQKGDVVSDVQLPVWAKGDPREFVRIHREALECRLVSENLHEWIDLIFGFKQRGLGAEEALNVFIHLTYDGEVDVDAITDPIMRDATIAQINNFGQTPSKLFGKPHPKKIIPDLLRRSPTDSLVVDANALLWHEQSVLTPPLCVAGAPGLMIHTRLSYNQTINSNPTIKGAIYPVGDVILLSNKLVAIPDHCRFLASATSVKKVVTFREPAGGISVRSINFRNAITAEDRDATHHEGLHEGLVTCVSTGKVGSNTPALVLILTLSITQASNPSLIPKL